MSYPAGGFFEVEFWFFATLKEIEFHAFSERKDMRPMKSFVAPFVIAGLAACSSAPTGSRVPSNAKVYADLPIEKDLRVSPALMDSLNKQLAASIAVLEAYRPKDFDRDSRFGKSISNLEKELHDQFQEEHAARNEKISSLFLSGANVAFAATIASVTVMPVRPTQTSGIPLFGSVASLGLFSVFNARAAKPVGDKAQIGKDVLLKQDEVDAVAASSAKHVAVVARLSPEETAVLRAALIKEIYAARTVGDLGRISAVDTAAREKLLDEKMAVTLKRLNDVVAKTRAEKGSAQSRKAEGLYQTLARYTSALELLSTDLRSRLTSDETAKIESLVASNVATLDQVVQAAELAR